jgi:eukaryotic translation initiation factor 2C
VTTTPETVESAVDGALHRFTSNPDKDPPMLVLVIMPSADSVIYNRVKYACDVKEGLINVCVTAPKFANANHRYLTNVALKFNLKLGGINQSLGTSQLGIISEGKTMVVGIDVTHPSPGSASTAPSVVGIVASIDKWLGQWPAELAIQTARKETVSELKVLIESRLALWKRRNGAYPENILIYRDGVSEGQYKLVLEEELPEIQSACKGLYPASLVKQGVPRISIIIVGKRHNTRFYPTKVEEADNSSNPQSGTVVDRGVTEARNWDFFMQAHKAIQGTARPAHYYVVSDEIFQRLKAPQGLFKNTSDIVEDLTHNLCYLFGRSTSAVSICPPAYYADLVCERARCYLSGLYDPSTASSSGSVVGGGQAIQEPNSNMVKIHENVRDTMFYI